MVSKGSVLVVDDEINLCRILGAKLAKSGYNVVAVHDGQQAVEKVRESEYDVVLLDLILPKMDGLSALAEIRRVRDHVPVIVMTACESSEVMEEARSHGITAYVNKPFDLDNLVALVRETSRSHSEDRGRMSETSVLFAKDQPVTIEVQNGCLHRAYGTRIWGKDDTTLTVIAPEEDGQAVRVAPRASVKVGLSTADAYYTFTSRVIGACDNNDDKLVLEKPGVIYRVQRRKHTRYEVRIPVECSAVVDGSESTVVSGEALDISLGGARLALPEEILPGELLRVTLRPKTPTDRISVMAQVMRSRRDEIDGKPCSILGCRFTESDDSLRKLLED